MMGRLEKVRGPAYNEIAGILQTDKEILEKMLEDKVRKQQFEKLKALLQKDAVKKKKYDDEFFATYDISAYLKHIKLSILFNAQKEEILKALEIDTLHFNESLKQQKQYIENALQQQKQYTDAAKAHQSSPELTEAQKLLENALQKETQLQSIISQFNLLQEKVNNWEMHQWKPTVTAAAKIAAQAISVQVSIDLASDPVYQTLVSALEGASNNTLSVIAEKQQEMEADIAEALSNRASVDNLVKYVPGIANELVDKNKNTHNAEQKKAVAAEVIDPIYKLHDEVIFVANLSKFYRHIHRMCIHHGLDKTYKKELDSWQSVRLAVKKANAKKYQALLNGYHRNIKEAYNNHIDDQEELYNLAKEGDHIKTSLEKVMDQIKELISNPEEQHVIDLRNNITH